MLTPSCVCRFPRQPHEIGRFVNVSPAQFNVKETINSLNFANRAKRVVLGKASKNREAAQSAVNKVTTTLSALQEANEGDSRKSAAASSRPANGAASRPAGWSGTAVSRSSAAARKPAPGGARK